MAVGDKVTCHCKGSWVDGKQGVIERLNIWSQSDQLRGHQIRIEGHGITILEEWCLEVVNDPA